MTVFSAGHRCPKCRSHRVERRALHTWFERSVLPRMHRHAYHCLDCRRRFWDHPQRRRDSAPPPEASASDRHRARRAHARRRRRLRSALRLRLGGPLEKTPYSRTRVYLAIGLAWLAMLALFFALRAYWPTADALVRAID